MLHHFSEVPLEAIMEEENGTLQDSFPFNEVVVVHETMMIGERVAMFFFFLVVWNMFKQHVYPYLGIWSKLTNMS